MEKQIKTYDASFEKLYDQFIDVTDTEVLISNITTETLESFLRTIAKFFYIMGQIDWAKHQLPIFVYIEKEQK